MHTAKHNLGFTDVVVIGGGPAGTATAIELASRGFSVTILERSDYHNLRIGETLPPNIVPHLVRLGLWQAFKDREYGPSYGIRSAWGSDTLHDMPHLFNPYGTGWHVDRADFDRLLMQRALDLGVRTHTNVRLSAIERSTTATWQLFFTKTDSKRLIHSRFLVDATGRNSRLGPKLGADYKVHDQLIGVASWFDQEAPTPPDDLYTLIETGEQEWWYSAPLPNGKRIAVLMTDLDLYQKGKRNSARYWEDRLGRTRFTSARMKSQSIIAPPRSYTAHSHHVVDLGRSGWLPVGDAMFAVDPLSGQGVCNALKIAEMAAETIKAHFAAKPGTLSKFLAQVNDAFATYPDTWRYYYSKETRWPKSDFWRRRRTQTNTLSLTGQTA